MDSKIETTPINLEYNIFRIPKLNKNHLTNNDATTLIGVIDSSGSMSSQWPFVIQQWNKVTKDMKDDIYTITFSANANIVNLPLVDNI